MGVKVKITYRDPSGGEHERIFQGDEMGAGGCYAAIQFLEDLTVSGPVQLVDVLTIDSGEYFDDEAPEGE
ncbi:UNVERIFIED_ORG: hypothetical protein M2193_000119 [Bradyrhizobium japonicum]